MIRLLAYCLKAGLVLLPLDCGFILLEDFGVP